MSVPPGFPEAVNTFFKQPLRLVPAAEAALRPAQVTTELSTQLAQVGSPGIPRPLWLVIAASVPTGLLWYGAGYKILVEEELFAYEVEKCGGARGYGGPGTIGPFALMLGAGLLGTLLDIPLLASLSAVAFVWIYFTQYLLYQRVNELYEERGLPPPLHVWWLIFPGFNLIVGLRQVHFLARFWALERGEEPPEDAVADFFPCISSPRFTWQEFLSQPSLWCSWF